MALFQDHQLKQTKTTFSNLSMSVSKIRNVESFFNRMRLGCPKNGTVFRIGV